MAAILASEAAQRTAKAAIQCHGAIGYTIEYELHRFAKRAWALASTVDVTVQVDVIASSLDLPRGSAS
jgi:alkylation response protein AidB-like acyl-CoA dehydrogenase